MQLIDDPFEPNNQDQQTDNATPAQSDSTNVSQPGLQKVQSDKVIPSQPQSPATPSEPSALTQPPVSPSIPPVSQPPTPASGTPPMSQPVPTPSETPTASPAMPPAPQEQLPTTPESPPPPPIPTMEELIQDKQPTPVESVPPTTGSSETLPVTPSEVQSNNYENQKPVETLQKQETYKAPEVPITPPPAKPTEKEEPKEPEKVPPAPELNKGAVVDRTEEKTQLHQIADTTDTLTKFADEEEEKFIKEVESAHGIK